MYYEKVFRTLQKNKVRYLIAGGMAVNLYGIPRFTRDLDLLVELSPANLKRLRTALTSLGFRPRIAVSLDDFLNPQNWDQWYKEKGMTALNLYNPRAPYEEIDILHHLPVGYEKAKKKEFLLKVGSLTLRLVSLDDLIRMKKSSGREQDLADIEALRKLRKMR